MKLFNIEISLHSSKVLKIDAMEADSALALLKDIYQDINGLWVSTNEEIKVLIGIKVNDITCIVIKENKKEIIMPVFKCANGKWRVGEGPCVFDTKEKADAALKAIKAKEGEDREESGDEDGE